MTRGRETQLLVAAGDSPAVAASHSTESPAHIAHVLHRLLRGRYVLAVLLGTFGAVAGGATGWMSQQPEFRCQGQIRILPVLPKILHDTEQTSLMPYFSGFVNTQASLLESNRVISRAMNSDAWRSLGRSLTPDDERDFRSRLKVSTDRAAQELIVVSFSHSDRRVATVAVTEVIRAFEEFYGREGSLDDTVKVNTLTELRRTRIDEANAIDAQIRNAAKEFGTDDLSELHRFYMTQLLGLMQRLGEVESTLADRGIRVGDPGIMAAAAAAGSEPHPQPTTPEQIAAVDQSMRDLLMRRLAAQETVDRLSGRGLGDGHPDVIAQRATLAAIERSIERYTAQWTAAGKVLPQSTGLELESDAQLLARYETLRKQTDEYRLQMIRIGNTQLDIQKWQRELAARRADITQINDRLEAINVERNVTQKISGRITVLSYGDTPSFPEVDPRRKFAAMGFMAGGGLPIGLIMLWGLARKRFRYSDEASELGPNVALLGVLPNLSATIDDPEEAAAASHCVHQIRTLLQLSGGGRKDRVYCMTSAEAGEGKTSLTLSLGLSFAKSGARTLLVDGDMIGRGLSSQLGVHSEHGLADALRAGHVNGTIVETPHSSVWLLPAGLRDDVAAPEISVEAVRRLISQIRDRFDIVLVDTGPVLGSLEAACLSAESDGVVVVVGRGQHRSRLERALARIRDINGRVVGLVFNRATATDFHSSTSAASIRSLAAVTASATAVVSAAGSREQAQLRGMGPLAGAMLVSSRTQQ